MLKQFLVAAVLSIALVASVDMHQVHAQETAPCVLAVACVSTPDGTKCEEAWGCDDGEGG